MRIKVLDAEIEVTIVAHRETFIALTKLLGRRSVGDDVNAGLSEFQAKLLSELFTALSNEGFNYGVHNARS